MEKIELHNVDIDVAIEDLELHYSQRYRYNSQYMYFFQSAAHIYKGEEVQCIRFSLTCSSTWPH